MADAFWGVLRGGHACRAHISDVKLRVGRVVCYPDVMVACGREPADDRLEDAPCLVVEVLSPSTEIVDRREKLTLTLEEIYEHVERPTPDQWRRLREEELAYRY